MLRGVLQTSNETRNKLDVGNANMITIKWMMNDAVQLCPLNDNLMCTITSMPIIFFYWGRKYKIKQLVNGSYIHADHLAPTFKVPL